MAKESNDCGCWEHRYGKACVHDFQAAAEAAGKRALEDESDKLRIAEEAGRREWAAREEARRMDAEAVAAGMPADPLSREHLREGHVVKIAGCPLCR